MNWIYGFIVTLIVRLDPKIYAILFVFLVVGNAALEALIRYEVIKGGVWQTAVMVISGILALLSAPNVISKTTKETTDDKRAKANASQGD